MSNQKKALLLVLQTISSSGRMQIGSLIPVTQIVCPMHWLRQRCGSGQFWSESDSSKRPDQDAVLFNIYFVEFSHVFSKLFMMPKEAEISVCGIYLPQKD
jgi:hypothetical protein